MNHKLRSVECQPSMAHHRPSVHQRDAMLAADQSHAVNTRTGLSAVAAQHDPLLVPRQFADEISVFPSAIRSELVSVMNEVGCVASNFALQSQVSNQVGR